jgi:hypothetical protein
LIAARNAQRRHHRFRSRIHEPHTRHPGHPRTEHLVDAHFQFRVDAEGRAFLGLPLDRLDHLRVGVPEDHCAPRAAEVRERAPVAVRIFEPCPDSTYIGVPPTLLKARTGLLTPPGITLQAR